MTRTRTDRTGIANSIAPLLLLVFVTAAAYMNAWPDNLTFDDKGFVASERFKA